MKIVITFTLHISATTTLLRARLTMTIFGSIIQHHVLSYNTSHQQMQMLGKGTDYRPLIIVTTEDCELHYHVKARLCLTHFYCLLAQPNEEGGREWIRTANHLEDCLQPTFISLSQMFSLFLVIVSFCSHSKYLFSDFRKIIKILALILRMMLRL